MQVHVLLLVPELFLVELVRPQVAHDREARDDNDDALEYQHVVQRSVLVLDAVVALLAAGEVGEDEEGKGGRQAALEDDICESALRSERERGGGG